MDIKLSWAGWGADCSLHAADLLPENELETAVILSLLCDARARDDDTLPNEGKDRRGWWADSVAPEVDGDRTGSRLWLLSREKTLPETLRRAKDYAEEALAWLTEDHVADSVTVTAEMPRRGLLALTAVITLPDGSIKTVSVNRSV